MSPSGLTYCRQACDSDTKGPCSRCHRPQLHPANKDVLRLVLASQTQARISPMGDWLGFDYQGVHGAALGMGMTITPEIFDKFQIAEAVMIKHRRARSHG